MMKLYFLLISCFMLLTGCNHNPVMSGPDPIQKSWIEIPEAAGLGIENSIFASARINGNQGGELILQGSYQTTAARLVTFESKLTVTPNAYSGLKILTEEVGDAAYAEFGPSMNFNLPLLLDFKITGLDLTGVDPTRINFYYMAPDGNLEVTQHDGIYIDVLTGTLKVTGARIHHFSRYGWAK